PRGKARFHCDILKNGRLARPNGCADRAAAPLGVRPRNIDRFQIAFFVAGLSDRTNGACRVLLRITDPAEPVAGNLDDGPAHFAQQGRFVGGPDDRLVAATDGHARAIRAPQLLGSPAPLGNIAKDGDASPDNTASITPRPVIDAQPGSIWSLGIPYE